MRNLRSTLAVLALAFFFLAGANLLHSRFDDYDHEVSDYHQTVHFYSPRLLKALSLGYDTFVADLLYMKMVHVIDWRTDRKNNLDWVYRIADAATTLDPGYRIIYIIAGVVLSDGDEEDIRNAILIYQKGAAHFKNQWRFNFWTAYNYYFLLGEKKTSIKYFDAVCKNDRAPPHYCGYGPRIMGEPKIADQLQLLSDVYCSQKIAQNKGKFMKKADSALKYLKDEKRRASIRRGFESFLDRCIR